MHMRLLPSESWLTMMYNDFSREEAEEIIAYLIT